MNTDEILGWVFLGSLILGNLVSMWRGIRKQSISIFWLSWLAVGILIYEAFRTSAPWWITVVLMGMVYIFSGPRTYSVFFQNYKFQRSFYYLCSDIPPALVYLFIILPNVNNFWALVLSGVTYFIWALIFSNLALVVFPIVQRQETRNSFAAQKNVQKVNELDAEIRRLEYQALRKKTLKRLGKQKSIVSQAGVALSHNNLNQALSSLNGVIAELEAVQTDLVQGQKTLWGQSYLLRAKIHCKLGKYSQADIDLNKSYQLIKVDEVSLAGFLDIFLDNSNFGLSLFNHCTRYLTLRKGKEPDTRQKKVWKAIQTYLAIKPGLSSGKYKEIIDSTNKVILIDPNLWWAHSNLGQAAYFLGDKQQSLMELEAAVRIYDKDAVTWIYLGKNYQQQNRQKDAQRAYEQALSLDENQPEIAHDLGLILLGRDDAGSAFRWLQLAVKLSPQNATYQCDLGHASLAMGDKKLAKEAVLKALEIDSKLSPAHLLAGNLFYDDENWKKALSHFEALGDGYLDDENTQLRLGRCYAENRCWEDAIRLLEPLREHVKDAFYPLGKSYLGRLDIGIAVDTLRQAVASNAGFLPAWYSLGCALAWQSQGGLSDSIREAQNCFERIVEAQHPLTSRARLQMGHIAMREHNLDLANKFYQLAYQSASTKKEAGLALVKVYLAQNRLDDSSQILASLDSMTKADQEARFVYGLDAEIRKDYIKAVSEYQTSEAHGPLGIMLFLSGKFEEAKRELEAARANNDQSDRVLYYSGLLHCQLGQYHETIREWQALQTRHVDDSRLELNIARVWYLVGCEDYKKRDYQKAAEAWEHFYKVYSTDEETRHKLQYLYLAIAFEKIGETESTSALKKARQLGASPEMIRYGNGLTALKIKNWNNAKEIFQDLVTKFPQNPVYLYNLGLALLFSQAHNDAEKLFLKALETNDNSLHERIRWGLAVISAQKDDWARVAAIIDVAA